MTGTLELVIPLGSRLGHPIWRRALRDAGVGDEVAGDVVRRIADAYVPWQEASFPGLLGNVVAGRIANYLDEKNISPELTVVLISTLPIVELRGAIPVAHLMRMNPVLAYLLAVAGNMIPVIPLLLLLGPVSSFCMRFKYGKLFFDWFFERARRKSEKVEKYETLGLSLFVAIPLPITGAWTGCAVALIMGIKSRHAFWAILLGVIVAGIIMTALCLLGWWGATAFA